jgi:CHASE3 domain sensor protein
MKRRTRSFAMLAGMCAVLGAAVWWQVQREQALARDP